MKSIFGLDRKRLSVKQRPSIAVFNGFGFPPYLYRFCLISLEIFALGSFCLIFSSLMYNFVIFICGGVA